MKTAIPHTLQIPVLSTKHMPNRYALDHLLKGNYITGADVLGGFLEVPKLEDCCAWLLPIRKWALSNVYDWIFFSADGEEVLGLEVYDWEAGDGRALAFNAVLNMPLSESFKLPAGAIIFASDLSPPDIKALRDAPSPFDIPRLPPPTQAEIDAFNTTLNDKRIDELRAAIAAYSEKMDDWQANADNEEELLRLLAQRGSDALKVMFVKPAVACNETVIHGTHRTQDLIPAFLDLLAQLAPDAYAQLMAQPFGPVPAYVQDEGDSSEWWTSEDAYNLLETLFDELDAHAPEGFYFGAHKGDSSDFGFWENEEE